MYGESLTGRTNLPELFTIHVHMHVLSNGSRVQQTDLRGDPKQAEHKLSAVYLDQQYQEAFAFILYPEVVGLGDLVIISRFRLELHPRFFDSIQQPDAG